MPLDTDAAIGLAGPDVMDLAAAEGVEPVGQGHVGEAEKAADAAAARADESERGALAGRVTPAQAAADREASHYAALRLAVTRRRAERHAQAERLRGLHAVGQEALAHANALKKLRDDTAADLATISKLHDAIRARIHAWSTQLRDIAERGAALSPDPLLPGGHPPASSASVWAGRHDYDGMRMVVGSRVITTVWEGHPDGVLAAIDAAGQQTRQHDPSVRLYVGENGQVAQVPAGGAGEHVLRKIDSGRLHELSLAEKQAYYRGEAP